MSFFIFYLYLLSVVFVFVSLKLVLWFWYRYQFLKTFSNLDILGPKPNFLTGNLKIFNKQYLFDSLGKWFDIYGDFIGYYRGNRAILVTKNPDLIYEIFIKRFQEFPNRLKFMVELQPFSSSILALRDLRWRQVRRIITPAFNSTKIFSLNSHHTINESAFRLLNILTNAMEGGMQHVDYIQIDNNGSLIVNVSNLSKRYTLDIICRYAFAIDNEDCYRTDSPLFHMVEEFFSNSCDNVLVRLAMFMPMFNKLIQFINKHITSGKIVDHLVAYLKKQMIHYNNINNANDQSKNLKYNLLDFILEQFKLKNLNENEAIGNLLVILLAGYETTACSLAFVLFNLAKHEEIQDRLRKELKQFETISDNASIQCEYLDRIIFESLRLYPPVIDYVIRETNDKLSCQNFNIMANGREISIPGYVAIQVPVWIIHHDPDIWPEPYIFNPDRCGLPIKANNSVGNKTSFLAFGIGQRSCIGGSLALAEIRTIVAALINQYHIQLLDNSIEQYQYDSNGLLKVKSAAELIEPCKDIRLLFKNLN